MVRFAPVPPVVAAKGIYSRPASFYPAEAQGAELANNYQMPTRGCPVLRPPWDSSKWAVRWTRKEHIAQMCRAFLAEKRCTLGGFGKLHRVRHRQQMLHLIQLFVNVDESALFQADTIQKYVRIQVRSPFCSS